MLIDWENIWISLDRVYNSRISPRTCLEKIVQHVRTADTALETVLFYGEHFREEQSLREAIRACAARGERIGASGPKPEKNLADTYLVVEALLRLFTKIPRPDRFVIVSGDNGYTALLRALEEQGTEVSILGLRKSMAKIISSSVIFQDRVSFLDEILGLGVETPPVVKPRSLDRIHNETETRFIKPPPILQSSTAWRGESTARTAPPPPPRPIVKPLEKFSPSAAPRRPPVASARDATAIRGSQSINDRALTDVVMPQMGESIVEGTLTKWLKTIGEKVERDEPLFEISTDKVDTEIPAPFAGTVAQILVPEGTTVPVNTIVARIEEVRSVPAHKHETEDVTIAVPKAGSTPALPGGNAQQINMLLADKLAKLFKKT